MGHMLKPAAQFNITVLAAVCLAWYMPWQSGLKMPLLILQPILLLFFILALALETYRSLEVCLQQLLKQGRLSLASLLKALAACTCCLHLLPAKA